MDDILKKVFSKYFRYKIKKDWSTKINSLSLKEEDEKDLASELSTTVSDSIEDIIKKIHQEIDMAYWLIDSTIQDNIDIIIEKYEEEDREEQEKLEKEKEEIEEELWNTEETGDKEYVKCSHKDANVCSCSHKHLHVYDSGTCGPKCNVEGARCISYEKEDIDEQTKEIMKNGGV